MATAKNLSSPDETRTFDKGRLEIVEVAGRQVGRATFEPGWRWSECVKPIAGTDTCQVEHFGYVVSGRMGLSYDDGSSQEVGPGDMAHMPAGHDAWILGDEPCVVIDFMGAPNYAKK
jgi:mannose-6-phosphate isomerase-like protein (cupin superfamily)